MFERWRWGRVPIEGGGWLVTFRHEGVTRDEDAGHEGEEREVRHAVMHSQFGWGVYAVCEYKAGERLGWYDGEEITAERWGSLGKHEGREHTIRTGWASKHTTQTVQCMNGIDGVAGMQYINTAYGRVEREQSTGDQNTQKRSGSGITREG